MREQKSHYSHLTTHIYNKTPKKTSQLVAVTITGIQDWFGGLKLKVKSNKLKVSS